MVAGITAARLSAKWATEGALKQRWSERKEKAYAEIVEALYDIILFCDLAEVEYMKMNERDNPKMADYRSKYSEAYLKIQRATDIGAFVISDDSVSILSDLRKRPTLDWNKNPPWEIYEEESRHFHDALAAIMRCAKHDLKYSK